MIPRQFIPLSFFLPFLQTKASTFTFFHRTTLNLSQLRIQCISAQLMPNLCAKRQHNIVQLLQPDPDDGIDSKQHAPRVVTKVEGRTSVIEKMTSQTTNYSSIWMQEKSIWTVPCRSCGRHVPILSNRKTAKKQKVSLVYLCDSCILILCMRVLLAF
jgi:hypothetical protein